MIEYEAGFMNGCMLDRRSFEEESFYSDQEEEEENYRRAVEHENSANFLNSGQSNSQNVFYIFNDFESDESDEECQSKLLCSPFFLFFSNFELNYCFFLLQI